MTANGLTLATLQRIAAQALGESEAQDTTILLVRAILRRPRLVDAIVDEQGRVTRDSLADAAAKLFGNSDTGAFSHDPFHATNNVQLVQAFKAMFDELRDSLQDRTFFFEKHRYVRIEKLVAISQDPNELDGHGLPVLDRSTGLPRKRYSEQHVYMAKNLVERPGLLRALDNANARGLFGRQHQDGWLNNKSLDRWLEQDRAQDGL
ncbi:type III secretion effector protein [Pseudomonas sp. SDO528_S397]